MSSSFTKWWIGFAFITLFQIALFAQSGINQIGSFEQSLPSYWTKGSEPTGATLTWATDKFRSMGRSLKIEKAAATSDSAMWESENMCDLWSEKTFANVDINLGQYYWTQNVNTNPTSDDQRWYVTWTFYRQDGSVIGVKKFNLNQTVATTGGWVADTTAVGELSLPEDSWKTIIRFIAGKNATGMVWTDDYILVGRNGGWAGQDWNTAVGVPTGWFYWLPPIGGNDGILNDGYENTIVTNEFAHTGNYSLKFDIPQGTHDGFVGTKRYAFDEAQPGDWLRISVWIKGANLFPDSAIVVGDQWSVSLTAIYHTTINNNDGWGQYAASPDIPLHFPNATQFDWKQFYVDVQIPEPPQGETAKSISVRLHPLGRFSGTVWMDDLHVEKLDLPELNDIGSFEQPLPSYWTKGNEPTGATLTWATDKFRSMGRSLKIEKAVTSDSAMWESENMCDLWSERHWANVDINLGQYYWTFGVNTNPTSDDQRWYVTWTFYRQDGSVIGVKKFNLNQTVATTGGWVADTTAVGELSLPEDSWKTIVRFIAGKNATGTVWTDDYIFFGRNGGWAGQDWNTSVGVPTGWFYWLPPIGGNDGILADGYQNTIVTNEAAYDGNYSLKFDIPLGSHDGFVGTKRFPLGNLVPGDSIIVSVWVKADSLWPDSAIIVGDQWSVSLTTIYHTTINPNDGWGQYAASPDIPLQFPAVTSFDWTQFSVGLTIPEPPSGDTAKSISVRLHPLGRFSGIVWMDKLEVHQAPTGVIQDPHMLPSAYNLFQNYPNPFNPTTTISYSLPKASRVTLKIYDLLGREVKTLVSFEQNGGLHRVQWDGINNYGSKVASGIYLYRIEAGDFVVAKKMILLK